MFRHVLAQVTFWAVFLAVRPATPCETAPAFGAYMPPNMFTIPSNTELAVSGRGVGTVQATLVQNGFSQVVPANHLYPELYVVPLSGVKAGVPLEVTVESVDVPSVEPLRLRYEVSPMRDDTQPDRASVRPIISSRWVDADPKRCIPEGFEVTVERPAASDDTGISFYSVTGALFIPVMFPDVTKVYDGTDPVRIVFHAGNVPGALCLFHGVVDFAGNIAALIEGPTCPELVRPDAGAVKDGAVGVDAGRVIAPPRDAGARDTGEDEALSSGGCACRADGAPSGGAEPLLVLAAALMVRRRRRASR